MKDSKTLSLKLPLLIFVAALLVRFLYLSEQQSGSVLFYQPLLDEQEMVQSARHLLATGSLGDEPLFKAPFYPVYLAAVMKVAGEGWFWLARALQHFCGALLVLIAFDTARRLTGAPQESKSRLAGLVAGLIVALYGPLVRLENLLVLDFFTVFFQSAMIWALVRLKTTSEIRRAWRWAAFAGSLAMISWLNRPTLTPVLPFLALWIFGLWTRRKKLSFRVSWVCLFLIIPMLGMGGFFVRNARVGEGMLLPWQGGYNFYHANRSGAHGKYLRQESFSVAQSGNPTRELAEAGFRAAVDEGKISPAPKTRYYHAVNAFWFDQGKQEIKREPVRWVRLMFQKTVYLATVREIFNFEDYDVHKELSNVLPWLPVNFGFIWPLALASIALVPAWRVGRRRLVGLLWLYILLLGGAIALYFVSGRLRMPLMFPVAVLAGSFVASILVALSQRKANSATPLTLASAVCLLVAAAVMSWGNWWGVRSENLRGIEFARLSNAAWRSGKPQLALQYANIASKEDVGYPTIPLLRAQALYNLGEMGQAALAFEESMKRLPDDPIAPFNRGIIAYYHENDAKHAAELFENALGRQPNYHKAAWMSALAYLRQGNVEKAEIRLRPYLPTRENAPPQLLIAAIALHTAKQENALAKSLVDALRKNAGDQGVKELERELQLLGLPKAE